MQGASGISLDNTASNANETTISSSKMDITYVCKLENNLLIETYKQFGKESSLTLSKFETNYREISLYLVLKQS